MHITLKNIGQIFYYLIPVWTGGTFDTISNFCSNLTFFYGFSSSLHKRHLRQSLKSNLSNGRRLVRQTLTLADVVKEKENFTWPYKLSADMEGDILLGNYSITGYYFRKNLVVSPAWLHWRVRVARINLSLVFQTIRLKIYQPLHSKGIADIVENSVVSYTIFAKYSNILYSILCS